jgi:hypothetical protein
LAPALCYSLAGWSRSAVNYQISKFEQLPPARLLKMHASASAVSLDLAASGGKKYGSRRFS